MKREAFLFVIVLYVLTWAALIAGGHHKSGPLLVLLVLSQALPGLVALVFCLLSPDRRARFRSLALNRTGGWRWWLFALIVPMAVIAFSYALADFAGLVQLKPVAERGDVGVVLLRHTKGYLYMMIIGTLPWAFAEEIGWRGYLQPLLGRSLSAPVAALVVGLLWSVWHYPFILVSDYYSGGNALLNCALFTLTVTAMGVVYGLTRVNGASVWPAVIMHAASNSAWGIWQYEYAPVSPSWVYFAGEAGLFNSAIWALLAAWAWRRFRDPADGGTGVRT